MSQSLGQTITGAINGTITDPAGAAIPNASVTVTSVQTGIQQKAQSNGSGNYIFPALGVGDYTITVEAQGFGTTTESGVHLDANQNLTADVLLKLAQKYSGLR